MDEKNCTECGDQHLADGEDCLLADVPTDVPEGVPDAAPDADDWDAAGVPVPEDFDDSLDGVDAGDEGSAQ